MKFRVKEGQHVTHGDEPAPGQKVNTRAYKEGELVELTADQAAAMPWAVEESEKPAKKDK